MSYYMSTRIRYTARSKRETSPPLTCVGAMDVYTNVIHVRNIIQSQTICLGAADFDEGVEKTATLNFTHAHI